ncbi:MAG TPA: SDR family NAD(P)-dependent oxidoreductase, partial [Pyrinomonadaceae bacterium]|nr:SDR family NAD(P)-dependent oxidoreductase [Pyrinomonadaceae bacterium]
MNQNIFVEGILSSRVAFVTGGGTGITGGVARALAEAGANVALVSRKLDHLEPAAKAINDARAANPGMGEAFPVVADVRNFEQVEEALAATGARFGKVDIVVNGAAGNFLAPAESLS